MYHNESILEQRNIKESSYWHGDLFLILSRSQTGKHACFPSGFHLFVENIHWLFSCILFPDTDVVLPILWSSIQWIQISRQERIQLCTDLIKSHLYNCVACRVLTCSWVAYPGSVVSFSMVKCVQVCFGKTFYFTNKLIVCLWIWLRVRNMC